MIIASRKIAILVAVAALAGCTGASQGGEDVEAFDGIAEGEKISLLGNEPFWGAKIADGTLTWSTPDNIDGETVPVTRFSGNNGLGFSGEVSGEVIQIAVTPGECSDGMSDRTYPFTVTITLGDRQLEGCGYTDKQPFDGPENP